MPRNTRIIVIPKLLDVTEAFNCLTCYMIQVRACSIGGCSAVERFPASVVPLMLIVVKLIKCRMPLAAYGPCSRNLYQIHTISSCLSEINLVGYYSLKCSFLLFPLHMSHAS
jgi:hypothetical protein